MKYILENTKINMSFSTWTKMRKNASVCLCVTRCVAYKLQDIHTKLFYFSFWLTIRSFYTYTVLSTLVVLIHSFFHTHGTSSTFMPIRNFKRLDVKPASLKCLPSGIVSLSCNLPYWHVILITRLTKSTDFVFFICTNGNSYFQHEYAIWTYKRHC